MNEDIKQELFFELTVNADVEEKKAYEIIRNEEYVKTYKAYRTILISKAKTMAAESLYMTIELKETNP